MKRGKKTLSSLLAAAMLAGLFPALADKAEAAEARKELPISQTLSEPIIDGKLDESVWALNESLQTVLSAEGADSLSSKFGMVWDSKYLYIGVATEDPNLSDSPNVDKDPTNTDGDYYWDHPNVTIFLDPQLHQSTPYQGKDVQLGFVYKPGTTTPYFSFGAATTNKDRDEKQILRAISKTDKGWNLETAIPWKFLDFDPQLMKQLGMEMTVGTSFPDGEGKIAKPGKAWSAYERQSFWNDTYGFGVVKLDGSNPVSGSVSDVLLEENFDGYANGQIPSGWISNVNAGSSPFGVVNDVYGDGRLVFDGNASGMQARIFAPVQWDNYTVEADLQFQKVLNADRWTSLMFRAPNAGVHPYNQMAMRQTGAYEIAFRNPSNNWDVPVKGNWGKALDLNKDYSFKVRAFDQNVKLYIKEATSPTYDLLTDKWMSSLLLERGKVGFQADQSKVSFKNLKVTRVRVESMDLTLPAEAEALTGPISAANEVLFSDGVKEAVPADRIKWYSSDSEIVRVVNNQLVPLKAGTAEVTAVFDNAAVERQIKVTPSLSGKQVTSLRHDTGYLLANVDQGVDLNAIEFQADFNDFTTGTVKGGELTWNAAGSNVVINGGMLTAEQKGLHKVTATIGTAAVDLLVAAKPAAESEYVLYESDFANMADGTLPDGWKIIEQPNGTAAGVKNGVFEVDATVPGSAVRVLLPDELKVFGNYKIEAEATHAKANDSSRWHSVMYRVQNDNYPYYQMAVRQNATASNGVEFAERTPANGWNVMETKSYKEAIQADKFYRYTIKTHGERVQQFINDELIVNTGMAHAYAKGGIGLQANGSLMKVARIKVTLQTEALPKLPDSNFANVMEPITQISLAPSIVGAVESAAQSLPMNPDKLPATVILHVNESLQVTGVNRSEILSPLKDALQKLDGKTIPAFYVYDSATVTKLVDYLKTEGIADAFIVSDQPALVKQARTAYPIIRGIIDFPQAAANLTHEQLMDIRRTTNANLAKIALLPEQAASQDNVEYLQERLITVWAKHTGEASLPNAVSHHKLITSGVNGIVTLSPETLFDALGLYNKNTTLVRKPWIIGHRGIPALAPENTLEGAVLAYEKGADIVENDIYITKDDQVVILHDTTLDRTTNGTGNIEDYTLAELKQLLANKQFPVEYPGARIPTLEEYFQEFKGKDLLHFIEIKTYNPKVIDPMLALIKQYDVEDQVVMISFIGDQIKRVNEKMPGMSQGLLTGGQANDNDISRSLYRVLDTIQPLNTTFNTSYPGFGKKFLEASKHRGITIWPWTYRDINEYKNAFAMGVYGLTTDYNHWSSDWADRIRPSQLKVELTVGGQAELKADVRTYVGTTSSVTPEVVVLSGHEMIEVNGGTVTAKANGTAYVTLRYTNTAGNSPVYDMYTQPVAIEVKSGSQPESVVIEPKTASIKVGETLALKATVLPEQAYDKSVTWSVYSSTADQVVSVAADGLVTAHNEGTAVIRAKSVLENIYADSVVTVTGSTPTPTPTPTPSTTPEPTPTPTTTPESTPKPTSTPGSTPTPTPTSSPTPAPANGGEISVDAKPDAAASTAIAEIGAEHFAAALKEAKDGEDGVKKVRVEVKGSDGAQNIEVMLPTAALTETSVKHQIEIVTEHGVVTLPSDFLNDSGGKPGTVISLVISKVDTALLSPERQQQIGNRPVIELHVMENGQIRPWSHAESSVSVSIPYTPSDEEMNKPSGIVVWYIDAAGKATAVPSGKYDPAAKSVRFETNHFSSYAVTFVDKTFKDISAYPWAKPAVEALAARDVIQGIGADSYGPALNITRADFVTLLVRALGLQANVSENFNDVHVDDYYYEALGIAKKLGLIEGEGDNRFHPASQISRQDMFTIVHRALEKTGELSLKGGDGVLSDYADGAQVSGYATDSVSGLIAAGLVEGSGSMLNPLGHATRAETAVLLNRILNKLYE